MRRVLTLARRAVLVVALVVVALLVGRPLRANLFVRDEMRPRAFARA